MIFPLSRLLARAETAGREDFFRTGTQFTCFFSFTGEVLAKLRNFLSRKKIVRVSNPQHRVSSPTPKVQRYPRAASGSTSGTRAEDSAPKASQRVQEVNVSQRTKEGSYAEDGRRRRARLFTQSALCVWRSCSESKGRV